MQWIEMMPKLSAFPNLVCLQLTFMGVEKPVADGEGEEEEGEEGGEDTAQTECIAAARKVLQDSNVKGEKKLIMRRVVPPHYTNNHKKDYVQSYREETFM